MWCWVIAQMFSEMFFRQFDNRLKAMMKEDDSLEATRGDFTEITLSADEVQQVCSAIRRKVKGLRTLGLRGCGLDEEGVLALMAAISDNGSSMEGLYLADNHIGKAGAKAVAEAISRCPKLEKLDLGDNSIGANGAKALVESLTCCPNLNTLYLRNNSIGEAGAKAVAEAISRCPNLKVLDLGENSIGDAGVKAVAESITRCPKLKDLHINNNSIGDAGAKAVAEAIPFTFVSGLYIQGNNYSPATLALIYAALYGPRHPRQVPYNILSFALYPSISIGLTSAPSAIKQAQQIKLS